MNDSHISLVLISPEMAKAMLEGQDSRAPQTPEYRERVKHYVDALKDGTWRPNGDAIITGA